MFSGVRLSMRSFVLIVSLKTLLIKNIPSRQFKSVHLHHEWAQPKSTGCKVVSFVINVAYFQQILQLSNNSHCFLWWKKK